MTEGSNRKMLVTGGAGGIGQAIVKRFCRSAFDVYFLDLEKSDGPSLAKEIAADSSYAGTAHFIGCDLSELTHTEEVVERLVKSASGIDVLINNAAIYPSKHLLEYSRDEYQKVQTVNVEAAVVCTNAVLPEMIKKHWGRIINISSITAFGKFSKLMPYVVSKAALFGLTRATATEMGEYGITVNGICPGAIPTDAGKIQGDPDIYNKFVLEQQALKRRGSVDDIANVAHFFSSDDSGFVTGQMLNVDGGWMMH
jgi:3-oxoacyl-[acyl-carrier protein] reductase